MDAGIATEDNVAWLRDNGYRYLVVSRQRTRRFDPERSTAIETRSHHKVHLHKVVDEDRGEVRLYCYSEERAKKEEGIARRFAERFESELRKLHEGLSRPRTRKGARLRLATDRADPGALPRRRAALHRGRRRRPAQRQGSGRHLEAQPLAGTMLTHPGVYCLRSNVHDWDPQTLGALTPCSPISKPCSALSSPNSAPPHLPQKPRTVPTVTSSSPSSPTNCPDHPQAPRRTRRERQLDHSASYPSKDSTVSPPPFRRKDGRTLHLRQATRAEQPQLKIYTALDLHPAPGGVTKLII